MERGRTHVNPTDDKRVQSNFTMDRWNAPSARIAWLMVGASLLAHGAVALLLIFYATTPALDIEFAMPAEVEFGLTEGVTVAAIPASTIPEPEPPAPKPVAAPAEPAAEEPKPEGDEKAKAEDKETKDDPKEEPPADEPPRRVITAADREQETKLPAGAQLAVRLNMAVIRKSPLAPKVRAFLAQIPDWKMLLDGSNIDPINDLDRLMVASPNLQSGKMLVAGRTEGTEDDIRAIVARMAEVHGATAEWRAEDGVQVADWIHDSRTARVLALVGPQHFTITRPKDLVKLLAVATARVQTEKARKGKKPKDELGADALLSMDAGDAMTLEVEGARNYARGAAGIPTRMRVRVRETDRGMVEFFVDGEYDDATEAEEAKSFWDRQRKAFSRNLFVAALGLDDTLNDATIDTDGVAIHIHAEMDRHGMELILGYLEGMMRDWQERTKAKETAPAAPTTNPPAVPAP